MFKRLGDSRCQTNCGVVGSTPCLNGRIVTPTMYSGTIHPARKRNAIAEQLARVIDPSHPCPTSLLSSTGMSASRILNLPRSGGSSVDSLMAASSGCTRVNSLDQLELTCYGVEQLLSLNKAECLWGKLPPQNLLHFRQSS